MYSQRVPLDGSPVTYEMIDTGINLKRSIELSETMMETWIAALVSKTTEEEQRKIRRLRYEDVPYEIRDPKHPDHYEVMADIWDNRDGK
jgi:hypothetical protein